VCLIAPIQVEQARTLEATGTIARRALAGLLALLLLAATTLSAAHLLHQTLDQNGSTKHHLCLLCSFAKGQVNATEVTFAAAALLLLVNLGIPQAEFSFLAAGDHRLSLSRAPPAR